MFISCNKSTDDKYKEGLKEFKENMEIHKEFVSKVNAYFKDSSEINFYEYMTDDCIIKSYVAGRPLETTVHEWINNLDQWRKYGGVLKIYNDDIISKYINGTEIPDDLLNLSYLQPLYLPGCDMNDYSLDGSVRLYYVASADGVVWTGYDSVHFKEGKISLIESFADFGGVGNLSKLGEGEAEPKK